MASLDMDDELTSVFEERAEHLSKEDLLAWSTETDRDKATIKQLKGTGAKLLSGPRGSGKSTLFRKAYFELLESDKVIPAYVNFSHSLALEPLFHSKANALILFRQWVVFKIIDGIREGVYESGRKVPESLDKISIIGRKYISELETGKTSDIPYESISPSELITLIEEWIEETKGFRCVLLLDDAAHAFSPEQQRDFFEIFRSLRTKRIAPKAAVYPGITSYSPYFHIGHEGKALQAWYEPQGDEYLEMMMKLAKNRLPKSLFSRFTDNLELLDLLALASFGVPRGFLNMVASTLGIDEGSSIKPTRRRAQDAIKQHAESVRNIFLSLRTKLPRLKNFIDVGVELERSAISSIKNYNTTKKVGGQKAKIIGIAEPITQELERILAMAEYAGLMRKMETVSRGEKGVFRRYEVHYALLISENALSLGKAYKISDVINSLSSSHAHSFVRGKDVTLLGSNYLDKCTINLEPCKNCGAERVSDEARFCSQCGAELEDTSVYEELLSAPIDSLPLPNKKIFALQNDTKLRTVQDILLDDEYREIKKAKYIGNIWASKVKNAAQEFVSV